MTGRVYDLVLHLLDHQIIATDGRLAGKVDDVELRIDREGGATVTGLLSGPGVLAERMGHTEYGRWRQHVEELVQPEDLGGSRIPLSEVREIGTGVRVNRPAEAAAAYGSERWVREHIISKIPGATDGGR